MDWNSQIHCAQIASDASELERAKEGFDYVCRTVGKVLARLAPSDRFSVSMRLYHGWYRGFQITDRRRAITQIVAAADFPSLSRKANVVIRHIVQYGDNLLSALPTRVHSKLNIHLPNTFRKSVKYPLDYEEKMVDTAIASDFVDLAHREPDRWLLILAEDDDLVPPIFVAEGLRSGASGRVALVRARPDGVFLNLSSLSSKP